ESVANEAKSVADALEDRRKAREGYDKFVVNVSRLERFKDVDPDDFNNAITAAGAVQAFLDNGSFTVAREKMDEAAASLQAVEKSTGVALESDLADGRAALAHGQGAAAAEAFTKVLQIQPDNELATKGLARAKNIEKVFALQTAAASLEAAGKLEEAQ